MYFVGDVSGFIFHFWVYFEGHFGFQACSKTYLKINPKGTPGGKALGPRDWLNGGIGGIGVLNIIVCLYAP